jgi:hypothetical protein
MNFGLNTKQKQFVLIFLFISKQNQADFAVFINIHKPLNLTQNPALLITIVVISTFQQCYAVPAFSPRKSHE